MTMPATFEDIIAAAGIDRDEESAWQTRPFSEDMSEWMETHGRTITPMKSAQVGSLRKRTARTIGDKWIVASYYN